jgi:predicted flap endonuclease-1-like 5' DNA nuclease
MTALALQALLLMAVAYFLGAALACLIRRSFHRAVAVPAERRVDPLPEYAGRDAVPAPLARPSSEPPRAAAPQPRPVAPPPAPAAQDLKRIQLIDADTEKLLHRLGVTRYEQIANWMRADVVRFAQALGAGPRIARENWIEQAQILAKGGETFYSARRSRGEAPTAVPTADQGSRVAASPARSPGEPLPRPMSRAGVSAAVASVPASAPPALAAASTSPLVSERAAFAAAPAPHPVAPPAAVPVRPAPPAERDNLQRIGGITAAIEQALGANGVMRYAQIAQWGAADVDRFERILSAGGRIARENWIEQAHILSRGGDTRFSREFDGRPAFHNPSLADAIRANTQADPGPAPAPPRTDLGALRSVRSQAYQNMPEPGPEAARRAAVRAAVSMGPDDLKRIRGIGVLIEKRLNSLGVSTYEHIANWTVADIERISQSLDFKGRIERENWVEQARILSAGGQTEFSRRVDRGEVESSRPRE